MNIKTINTISCFFMFFFILLLSSAFSQNKYVSSLDSMIQETIKNNPKIQEYFNNWQKARQKIKTVKSLDDPMFMYGKFGNEVQTKVGPQEQKFGISQRIPFPGKRMLKGKIQDKYSQVLEQEYESVKNEIVKEVKFIYFDIFLMDKSIDIENEEQSILEKIEKVTQRKYEVNLISQQDVIKVQVELSKIIKKILTLKQQRASLSAKLASILDRKDNAQINKIYNIGGNKFDYSLDELLSKVKETRQDLLETRLLVNKARNEKTLSKMSYLPDFTFGFEYVDVGNGTTSLYNDGEDAWIGKVSINIPIWFGKLRANVKEKEFLLKAAENKNKDLENKVKFEVQDAYLKINLNKDVVSLYRTALVPQAKQAFDISQKGFETGNISFLDWLDAERTYLKTRLDYYKSIAALNKSIAYMEKIIGVTLLGENNEK